MRVISGLARGIKLKTPDGLNIRPTTDRVKESVFNIIQFDVEGRNVLDLFAGTGQLGIEALSRGAKSATFVEKDNKAVEIIKNNLKATGFSDRAVIIKGDFSTAFWAGKKSIFDLCFLDPPYSRGILDKAISMIVEIDILSANGIIICESSVDDKKPTAIGPLVHKKEYVYGKVRIDLFKKERGLNENGNIPRQL